MVWWRYGHNTIGNTSNCHCWMFLTSRLCLLLCKHQARTASMAGWAVWRWPQRSKGGFLLCLFVKWRRFISFWLSKHGNCLLLWVVWNSWTLDMARWRKSLSGWQCFCKACCETLASWRRWESSVRWVLLPQSAQNLKASWRHGS